MRRISKETLEECHEKEWIVMTKQRTEGRKNVMNWKVFRNNYYIKLDALYCDISWLCCEKEKKKAKKVYRDNE